MGVLSNIAVRGSLTAAAPARPTLRDLTPSLDLLVLMLVTDLGFVLLAVALQFGWVNNPQMALNRDRGYPEFFQYIKLLWVMLCFGLLLWRVRQPVFGVLAALFFYFLLDDSLSIHERGGDMLADWLNFAPALGLRAKDFGEMLVSGLAVLALLLPGWLTYRASDAPAQRVTRLTLAGVLLLAFFGVVVDMAGMPIADVPKIGVVQSFIEDGGEMIAMSFIAAGTFAVTRWYQNVSPATAPPAP